jgi:enamine deaminase RidA (YjgF/YER057c/UK114 family)
VPFDEDRNVVGPNDPEAQTRQVFDNLRRALAAAGATFADVVKLNYYVADASMIPAVRDIRDEYIDTVHPPAGTAVRVVALAFPEFMIEIEAWAICEDGSSRGPTPRHGIPHARRHGAKRA